MNSETRIVIPVTPNEKTLLSNILSVEAARLRLLARYSLAGELSAISFALLDPNYEGTVPGVEDELKIPLMLVYAISTILEEYIECIESQARPDMPTYKELISKAAILKDLLYKIDHS